MVSATRKLRFRDSETTKSRLGNYRVDSETTTLDSETTWTATRKLCNRDSETTHRRLGNLKHLHRDSETTTAHRIGNYTRWRFGNFPTATRQLRPRLGNYGHDSETTATTRKLQPRLGNYTHDRGRKALYFIVATICATSLSGVLG